MSDALASEVPEPGTEHDPFAVFASWFADAQKSEPEDPNAMAIATVDASGLPNVRMVLLKSFDADGFVFYTNTTSQKGRELEDCPKAAGVLHWKSLRRQVRFRGPVSPVSAEEADAYFSSRARDSRIGAWASKQSQPLESRFALETSVAREAVRFGVATIPRPPHWSGYRIAPVAIEFWSDRPFRLHERTVYRRGLPDEAWTQQRLYP